MTGEALPGNLVWDDGCLRILDQRALPARVAYIACGGWQDVQRAIQTLAVRGAPAIGLAGAYGVALAARGLPGGSPAYRRAIEELAAARPTAANLARCVAATAAAADAGGPDAALAMALSLHRADAARCAGIAALGADLLAGAGWVLTHCHTGALATGGVGTALGAIAEAHRRGGISGVYACETRPLLQGARLTAWECSRLGIPCRLIVDSAVGAVLAAGRVGAVAVGADRIAANGDTANKIGTYPVAVLASRHAVPLYVAAPWSTIDPALATGAAIPIEERDGAELLSPGVAPGTAAYNPAFDVTPGALIAAIITETAILRRPYALTPEEAPRCSS